MLCILISIFTCSRQATLAVTTLNMALSGCQNLCLVPSSLFLLLCLLGPVADRISLLWPATPQALVVLGGSGHYAGSVFCELDELCAPERSGVCVCGFDSAHS